MKYNNHTITLTTQAQFTKEATELRATCLQILLGDYNKLGRSIPLNEYEEIKKEFELIIGKIEHLYTKYN